MIGVEFSAGLGILLFDTISKAVFGNTQPPIQLLVLSQGVKRPKHEADHQPPSTAEVKQWVELCLISSNTSSWRGSYLSTGTPLPLKFMFPCRVVTPSGSTRYLDIRCCAVQCKCHVKVFIQWPTPSLVDKYPRFLRTWWIALRVMLAAECSSHIREDIPPSWPPRPSDQAEGKKPYF
jgi:hypothetical protein